jgi:hypothetical protein
VRCLHRDQLKARNLGTNVDVPLGTLIFGARVLASMGSVGTELKSALAFLVGSTKKSCTM